MKTEVWWQSFGPFERGEDDLPHMGQVLAHFSKMQGYRTRELAEKLTTFGWKIGERRLEQLMAETNRGDPQQISRRKLLARVLTIPPVLLGLSHVGAAAVDELVSNGTRQARVEPEGLLRYESVLTAYWGSFYHASVQRNADGIQRWQQHIEELTAEVDPSQRPLLLALLCRFDQLLAVTKRDETDYVLAMHFHNQSVTIAKELNNVELLAAGLFRRARTRLRLQQIERAMEDMTQAVQHARSARPNLRGYVFQMAGEVVTRLPKSRETIQQFSRLMDASGHVLRTGPIEDDGSGAHLTAAGYHQDRARGFLRLGETEEALDAIALADQHQPPPMTRWQVELRTLRAQTYAQSGDAAWACQQLEEALQIVTATQSAIQRQNIRDVYRDVATRYPTEVKVRQLAPLIPG